MNDVSEQQMAERIAPAGGPGREAAEAGARRELHEAREKAKFEEYQAYAARGSASALAALATTWLSARKACRRPDDLSDEDASELISLVRIAERMGQSLACNATARG